jgi:hypothetical protein
MEVILDTPDLGKNEAEIVFADNKSRPSVDWIFLIHSQITK